MRGQGEFRRRAGGKLSFVRGRGDRYVVARSRRYRRRRANGNGGLRRRNGNGARQLPRDRRRGNRRSGAGGNSRLLELHRRLYVRFVAGVDLNAVEPSAAESRTFRLNGVLARRNGRKLIFSPSSGRGADLGAGLPIAQDDRNSG